MKNIIETKYDFFLMSTIILMLLAGSVMVISAGSFIAEFKFGKSDFFLVRQIKNVAIAVVLFLVAVNIPYKFYKNKIVVYLITATALASLVYLLISGHGENIKGATRWIRLPGFSFQPSELTKFSLIIFFSYSLNKNKSVLKDFLRGYLYHLFILAVFIGLIFLQPAFSTSMMIFGICFLMFYLSGMAVKHMVISFFFFILPTIIIMAIFQPYRMDRIKTFFNHGSDQAGKDWQVEQSLIGFGHGGFTGTGLGESRQKEFYLPEPHNDFIFSIIGDELGLIGTLLVITGYIIIIFRGFNIAKRSVDFHGFVLANGITVSIAIYAIFNMSITLGLAPPTGLPLPLISYGGTSLMITMFLLGILFNIDKKSRTERLNEAV